MKLYLASVSPRRHRLLRQLGIPFLPLRPKFYEPKIKFTTTPRKLACSLALLKALSCTERIKNGMICGMDTIVVIKKQVLGKPINKNDARRMLKLLSGKTHYVITGTALIKMPKYEIYTGAEKTLVTFRVLTDQEINTYISTSEPYDKAGAYAIQGKAGVFISRISGCYLNVVGLPVGLLLKLLNQAGWKPYKV